MAQTPDFKTGLFLADTSSAAGTVTLPFASQLQGRIITIKDANESFGIFPLYVETSVGDTFQDGSSSITLDITNSFVTLVAYGNIWYTIGTYQNLFNSTIFTSSIQVSSVQTNVVNLSNIVPLNFTPVANDFSWVNSLLYTSSNWVATGLTSGTPQGTIQTSSNGLNWVPQINPLTEGYAVAYNGSNLYAAVGYTDGTSNSTINTSPDTITWTPRQTTLTRVRAVAHNQYDRWMAGGYTDGTSNGTIQTSTDGTTWTALTTTFTDVYGIAKGSNIWVAVGYTNGTSNGTLQTTNDDGITWTARSVPFTTGFSVGFNGANQWVALGYTNGTSNGTLLTSADAQTWTAQTNQFTSSFGNVVYGGGQWVAVGNAGESTSASIQRSVDGSNWVPVSNLLTEGYAAAYNGVNQWVVGGYTDGTTYGTLQTSITNGGLVFSNTELYFLGKKILTNQTTEADSVAIGTRSGIAGQSTQSVAIGFGAGELRQQEKSLALGAFAGQNDQSKNSIALGTSAGQTAQGSYAVAIGALAGQSFQADHSIILNATASTLNTSNTGLFVSPIREFNSGRMPLSYNTMSKEIIATNNLVFNTLYTSSISTYNLTVYGPSTLTVQGLADITQLKISSLAIQTNVGVSTTSYALLTLSSGYLLAGGFPISSVGDVTTAALTSSIAGFASLGYVSTASLVSTTEGIIIAAGVSLPQLVSTVGGLGDSGYLSTVSLISTVGGLGTSGYLSTVSLISTVGGLGTSGYLSTVSLISTVGGLGDSGYLSTVSLISTVGGLGDSGYLSTTTAKTNFAQATLPTNQTIPFGVDTVIQFTDDIDPNNWWDSSTYRFQPNIAGYYVWHVQVWWQQGVLNGTNQNNIQVRKNGGSIAITQAPVTSTIGNSQSFSRITQLNGTTDYLDVTAFTGNTTSQVLNGGANGTYFYATLQ
jgi:hypothetical protein